jgi:hypothetical protein
MNVRLALLACLVLLVPAAALAQGDPAAGERLAAEGAAFHRAGDLKSAAAKYAEAANALEAAAGKDKPDLLKRALLLRRDAVWCRGEAWDFGAMPAAFDGFFASAARLGGSREEEESVRDCLERVLESLAGRRETAAMETVHGGYADAVRRTLDAARSDPSRARALAPFLDRVERSLGRALLKMAAAYRTAGDEARARDYLARAAAFWEQRKDLAELCRSRALAGEIELLKKAFAAYFESALAGGGGEEGEAAVREALSKALEDLAVKGDEKQILAVHAAHADALQKALAAGRKDTRRVKELEPALSRLDRSAGLAQDALAFALLGAGIRERGTLEYKKAVKAWEDRKDFLQASWTATNAFIEVTLYRRTEFADFFLVEALQGVRRHRYSKVEGALAQNFRSFLNRLFEEKKADEAIRFLESAVVLGKISGAFAPGIDEGHLRQCLDEFLWMKEAWDKVVSNGDALARLGKEAKYPYREALGSFFSGWGCLKRGANEDAIARFDACIAAAGPAGDARRLGYGWVGRCRALSALKKFEEADAAARKGMAAYEAAGVGTGLTQARQAALENARAWGNPEKTGEYENLIRGTFAAGGRLGLRLGTMPAQELARRAAEAEKTSDLLEISREGTRLRYRNLLDGSVSEEEIDAAFHYTNVSGALFQVKGPELLLWHVSADGAAPEAAGETVTAEGGTLAHEGPDFSMFGQRHLADAGSLLRVTSSGQLTRVKKP